MSTQSSFARIVLFVSALTLLGAACDKTTTTTNTNTVTNVASLTNEPKPTESGCAQEGSIKSPASLNKATIKFDNQTDGDVKLYWLDFDGARTFYIDVKAHSTYDQDTWIGHVWVVTDSADQCLKLHSANAVMQTVVMN